MKKLHLILSLVCSVLVFSQTPFVTKWKVAAGTGNEEIKFYAATTTVTTQNVSYNVAGGTSGVLPINFTGTEASPALITLLIPRTGTETTVNIAISNLIAFKLNSSESTETNTESPLDTNVTGEKLLDVVSWGTSAWRNLKLAFAHTKITYLNPTDTPNLTAIDNSNGLYRMLYKSEIITIANINNWNVTSVKNFREMFGFAIKFNSDISSWTFNTSNSIDMDGMFRYAAAFNQPIGNWNVSMVNRAQQFLQFAAKYNHPVPNFKVTNLSSFMYATYDFNQPIENINFENTSNISQIFSYTYSRSPYKNTLILDKMTSDKTTNTPYSNYVSVNPFIYHDPTLSYKSTGSVTGSSLVTQGRNSYEYNPKYPVGTIYAILNENPSATNSLLDLLHKSRIGVLKEKIVSATKTLRGEEFIGDQLYGEPSITETSLTTPNTFKMNASKDVLINSKSLATNSQSKKTIVNTNSYTVGSKAVVYKKNTSDPQDVSKNGTMVYDFTDNHLYVSKNGLWHRADN